MELRFTQVHITILNFILIGALSLVSVMCVRDIAVRAYSNQGDAPVAASAVRRVNSGVRTRAYYELIVKRDIFNLVPQESGPAPVVVEDLHLKLIGTSLLSKSKPYAIIEDQKGNESLYQVGENIPDAGRLMSVETNRAIIDRGGTRVAIDIPALEIPEAAPSQLGGAVDAPLRGIPAAVLRRMRGGGRAPASEDEDNSSDGDSKLELKNLGLGKFEASCAEVAQTMQNPAAFIWQMRALPHFVKVRCGFLISQKSRRGRYSNNSVCRTATC